MAWYDYRYTYPIEREITVPWFRPLLFFFALIYIIAITLVNVVAVGYNTIVYSSTDYNGTHGLWYDKFVPSKPSNYSHRSCDNALIRVNDYVSTNSDFNFFLYQLLNYIDLTADAAITTTINGVNYTNNPFFDCSLSTLQMTEYLEPVSPDLKATAIVGCNTTAYKYLQLRTTTDTGVAAPAINLSPAAFKNYVEGIPGPLGVENSVALWALMTRKVWYSLTTYQSDVSPLYDRNSLLRLSLVNGTTALSYIRFAYTDTYFGETPADGNWTMQVTYRNETGAVYNSGSITFLTATGQAVAASSTEFFNDINNALAPTIRTIEGFATAANVTSFDFWEMMNWMFVSQYWLLLLDFGQLAPSTFQYDSLGNLISYAPVQHSSQNNIFLNATLFDQYNSYLRNTILPLFGYTLADFLPLDDSNRMNQTTVSLKMLYTCTDLQLKDSAGLVISIFVADWGLLSALTTAIVIFFALLMHKKPDVNHCVGCVKLHRDSMALNSPTVEAAEMNFPRKD